MASDPHPAEVLHADLATAKSRARIAIAALALILVVLVFDIPVRIWQMVLLERVAEELPPPHPLLSTSDAFARAGEIAYAVGRAFTGVVFLRWLHRAVGLTRALGAPSLRHGPRDAVLAFVNPYVCFKRPFEVIRDTHVALAPDGVPEPPQRASVDEYGGYRDVELSAPPLPADLPHASIAAWWVLFWTGNLLSRFVGNDDGATAHAVSTGNIFSILEDAVEIASALLAVTVVRGVTARLVERYRRVRHNSVEALAAAGIAVGAPAG